MVSSRREGSGDNCSLRKSPQLGIGSDPGLLRLRMATRTTAALGCAVAILFLLTRATGQPLTVALLGVVITIVAARPVNEPDPQRQPATA